MATKRGTKRKDKSRVVLKRGNPKEKTGRMITAGLLKMGKDIQSMLKHWKNFVSKKKL